MKTSRILIVVNGTDAGADLEQTVAARIAEGGTEFKLLVPAGPDPGSWTFTRGEAGAAAEERLRKLISQMGGHRAEVRGEVTHMPAMDALKDAVSRDRYDELILSTPSAGVFTLVRFDLYRASPAAGNSHDTSRRWERSLFGGTPGWVAFASWAAQRIGNLLGGHEIGEELQ
ncbi:MAG: hypothetical protein WD627_04315 [Actinomycetota bacterium]